MTLGSRVSPGTIRGFLMCPLSLGGHQGAPGHPGWAQASANPHPGLLLLTNHSLPWLGSRPPWVCKSLLSCARGSPGCPESLWVTLGSLLSFQVIPLPFPPWMDRSRIKPPCPGGALSTLSCALGSPHTEGTQPSATIPVPTNLSGITNSWSTAVAEDGSPEHTEGLGTSEMGPPHVCSWLRGATNPRVHSGEAMGKLRHGSPGQGTKPPHIVSPNPHTHT